MLERWFRFFDNLIYGRRGDADDGEGIAFAKARTCCTINAQCKFPPSMRPAGSHLIGDSHVRADYVRLPDTFRVKPQTHGSRRE